MHVPSKAHIKTHLLNIPDSQGGPLHPSPRPSTPSPVRGLVSGTRKAPHHDKAMRMPPPTKGVAGSAANAGKASKAKTAGKRPVISYPDSRTTGQVKKVDFDFKPLTGNEPQFGKK